MPADATVRDLLAAADAIAPFRDAADWDNVGLIAGAPQWPVKRVLLAIDLTDAVAREALAGGYGAVVVYHPPVFKGTRNITPHADAPTSLLPELLANRVALLALHTALDHAPGGTNDVLLDAFDTRDRRPLSPLVRAAESRKLVTFVPAESLERVRRALADAGAGVIGHYSECSFESPGHGTFLGDETTRPAVGRSQSLERVAEIRLEMVAPAGRLGEIVRALCAAHPYEEPAFDLYPLSTLAGRGQVGSGRIAALRRPATGPRLLAALGRRVDLSNATVVGNIRRRFDSVTAAAGSYGVGEFHDARSLVLTGEMKHHDALVLLKRGVAAVCLDHFASERPVLDSVARRLSAALIPVRFRLSRRDCSPFRRWSPRA